MPVLSEVSRILVLHLLWQECTSLASWQCKIVIITSAGLVLKLNKFDSESLVVRKKVMYYQLLVHQ